MASAHYDDGLCLVFKRLLLFLQLPFWNLLERGGSKQLYTPSVLFPPYHSLRIIPSKTPFVLYMCRPTHSWLLTLPHILPMYLEKRIVSLSLQDIIKVNTMLSICRALTIRCLRFSYVIRSRSKSSLDLGRFPFLVPEVWFHMFNLLSNFR